MTLQSSLNRPANLQPACLSNSLASSNETIITPIVQNCGDDGDGILILTEDGQCVESNSSARCMCDRINQDFPSTSSVPQEIWNTCQILIDSRKSFPNHLTATESELKLKQSHCHVRIRARWFNRGDRPYILVILENQKQSKEILAITEAIRYGLSPREVDVWILHRIGYSYQEIAAELHIALNTVKKHMKNTYAKQQMVMIIEESYTKSLASQESFVHKMGINLSRKMLAG
ncbi:helix-turn-helix transcriptional regulator [Leptothoe sp. ISB3NOV94-8A]|uniref:LuxR family transcriptional regulator n=1 Tax=Adonisia turfae CCMR0081 TaxID=2292702 RepID=A0A6M0RGA8_9CYAN|nr:helix-turn-helix transcriptional regulator [Adonisia turfae]NEZ55307.1 LuxR family transcriptional regulator [Adonisia turfae CCMR0081]